MTHSVKDEIKQNFEQEEGEEEEDKISNQLQIPNEIKSLLFFINDKIRKNAVFE